MDLKPISDELLEQIAEQEGENVDLWISVYKSVKGSKLRRFAKMAGCSECEALGILVHLWMWAADGNADKDGFLPYTGSADLESCIAYGGISDTLNPADIVKCLFDSEWLDKDGDDIFLHDWSTWQAPLMTLQAAKKRDADRNRENRRRERERREQQEAGQAPETPPASPPAKPQKPAAKTKYPAEFENFWNEYPRKIDKGNAYKAYSARLNDGWSEEELIEAAKEYARQCRKDHTEDKYIKHGSTFLSSTTPFKDFLPKKFQKVKPVDGPVDGNPFIDGVEE